MKKVIALAIVAVMLVCSVSAIYNAEDTTKVYKIADENLSFDTLLKNGAQATEVQPTDGSANLVIDGLEGGLVVDDTWDTVGIRGWVGFKTRAQAIEQFGYKINEGEAVFDDTFKKDTEDAVIGASQVTDPSHASRFEILVPVAGITEATLLTAVAKLADGSVVDIVEFSINGHYAPAVEEPENPDSADAAIVVVAAVAAIALAGVVVTKKVRA